MTWIYRNADTHKCRLPDLDSKVRVGDVWKCDECGVMYIVRYNQRENSKYITKATQGEINFANYLAGNISP